MTRLRTIAACFVALSASHGVAAQSRNATGPLAERLLGAHSPGWRSVARIGVVVHALKGTPADTDIQSIADSVAAIRREILHQLNRSASADSVPAAQLFFLESRETMQRLTARPLAGFIQPGEPTGFFVYTRAYNVAALLRHELTHLYTFQYWGAPQAGPWLVEGIAVWAAGRCQGHTPDELAAGVRARGSFVPLTELSTRFRELPEDVAMPEAGSISGFLIRREGLAGVIQRWTRPTERGAHPLGRRGAELEAEWLAHLDSVRPASLDIPRMMNRGC